MCDLFDKINVHHVPDLQNNTPIPIFDDMLITVSFDDNYLVYAISDTDVYVCDNKQNDAIHHIQSILNNPSIVKILDHDPNLLYQMYGLCNNIEFISDYIQTRHNNHNNHINRNGYNTYHNNTQDQLLMNYISEQDDIEHISGVVYGHIYLVILMYKTIKRGIKLRNHRKYQPRKPYRKLFYSRLRNNVLLYLTVFNQILIESGPMKFVNLVSAVKKYKSICQKYTNPAFALNCLITVGALTSDPITSEIYF